LLKLIIIKVVFGAVCGIVIDLFYKRKPPEHHHHDYCTAGECGCSGHTHNDNVFLSALKHTAKIFAFVFAVNLIFGGAVELVGEEKIASLLLSGTVFQPVLCALVGFIPNCAASVLLTELFVSGGISFGSLLAGLCSGAGLGLAVLFKTNRNRKENAFVLLLMFLLSALCGILADFTF
jgi:uncharacterized membrane protein YraQ (UPF0718 family)